MSSSFHPGRVAIAVVTAFLLMTFGLPQLREARLERRAAALHERLGVHAERQPAAPPWQSRWEDALERIGHHVDAAPERPSMDLDGDTGTDLGALSAWADGLRAAAPGLDELLAQVRRFPPTEVPHLASATSLLGAREWQSAILIDARRAAERGDPQAALSALDDALMLARATDSGDTIGGAIRYCLEDAALRVARELVAGGSVEAAELRRRLAPHLDDWAADGEANVARVRRDVAGWLALLDELEGPDRSDALATWVAHAELVEEGLVLARANAREILDYGRTTPFAERNPWFAVPEYAGRRHALRNVALTTLALLEHEDRHGSWPATLADLQPASPGWTRDPATEAELPWRVEREGTETRLVVGPAAAGAELVWTVPAPR